MTNPLAGNPLRTRDDLQQAMRDLYAPLARCHSAGGARVPLGATGAHFPDVAAELEGFARPLWGLVPLAAGGAAFDWSTHLRGLAAGTDPAHDEYWGPTTDLDQRSVEMAAIGFALASVPDQLWEPLEGTAKRTLAAWLHGINDVELADNNWRFFRVLVNLGLQRVGERHDAAQSAADLDRLESFALGDGWYSDGPGARRDHYVPFAMHLYGLLYAQLAGDQDPERAERFRERAATFAPDFASWFADDGTGLAFGRSLTYRFAIGSFWAGLAYADVDALPWGQVKGLLLRHLRSWADRPIADHRGLLTIGYGYPNLVMAEPYNSPGSPYWAAKAFLPLALDETHPFWAATEAPLDVPARSEQPHPGMVLTRDDAGHVTALASGQEAPWLGHGAEKYAKFAYSTAFAFSVPAGGRGLEDGAHDSMLALSDDDVHWRVRETLVDAELRDDGVLWSRWLPWPDVEVETWLVAAPPWHVRVHHVRTGRTLHTAEGGFALDRTGDDPADPRFEHSTGPGEALAVYAAGLSGVRDLDGQREGRVVRAHPNTNLVAPRTVLPTLLGEHGPGEHRLRCAVLAVSGDIGDRRSAWDAPPADDQRWSSTST